MIAIKESLSFDFQKHIKAIKKYLLQEVITIKRYKIIKKAQVCPAEEKIQV